MAPERPNAVLCVGAVVLRENEVLLVRQAEGHALAGQWTIPWGFVDPGEAPLVAALRETEEEGGVVSEALGLLGTQDLPDEGWLALVFLCQHASGEPRPDGKEVDAAGYFGVDALDHLDGPMEPWSEWLVRRVLHGEHRVIPRSLSQPYAGRDGFL